MTTAFITEDMVEQGALALLREKLGYASASGPDIAPTVTLRSGHPTSRSSSKAACAPL